MCEEITIEIESSIGRRSFETCMEPRVFYYLKLVAEERKFELVGKCLK